MTKVILRYIFLKFKVLKNTKTVFKNFHEIASRKLAEKYNFARRVAKASKTIFRFIRSKLHELIHLGFESTRKIIYVKNFTSLFVENVPTQIFQLLFA